MDKFDQNSRLKTQDLRLKNIIATEDRHPDRNDWEPHRFSIWDKPLVKVSVHYGKATAYTRSYGLIEWLEPDRTYRLQWFPAAQIKRVKPEDWHGN